MAEEVNPEAMSIALLEEILKNTKATTERLNSIEATSKEQVAKGEIYPANVTVTDAVKEVNPGVGMWKVASIYNDGPNDCSVQINKRSLLLTQPVNIGRKVSKDFEFTTEVIEKVFAKCASGENCDLEIEFKR